MRRLAINNMIVNNVKRSQEYQATIINLMRAGVITKEKAEELLDAEIPAHLLPKEDNKTVAKEKQTKKEVVEETEE